jgi:hypothetical protein
MNDMTKDKALRLALRTLDNHPANHLLSTGQAMAVQIAIEVIKEALEEETETETCRWRDAPDKHDTGVRAVYTRTPSLGSSRPTESTALAQEPVAWVKQILDAFPLFDDDGLNEEEHHCEWALQQDRKRLHSMLATPPAAPASQP